MDKESKALRASIEIPAHDKYFCRFCGEFAQCAHRPISRARSERDDDAMICLDCAARVFWLFARINPAIAERPKKLRPEARRALDSEAMADEPQKCGCAQADCPECSL